MKIFHLLLAMITSLPFLPSLLKQHSATAIFGQEVSLCHPVRDILPATGSDFRSSQQKGKRIPTSSSPSHNVCKHMASPKAAFIESWSENRQKGFWSKPKGTPLAARLKRSIVVCYSSLIGSRGNCVCKQTCLPQEKAARALKTFLTVEGDIKSFVGC